MYENKEIKIGKTKIGGKNPCFIVAEVGINFDGKFDQAIKLINIAADSGCNAAKFQLFKSERMYPPRAGKYKTAAGKYKDILSIVSDGELPLDWIIKLKKYTNQKGMEFFASACDEISADLLEKCNVDVYKIPSYEITHLPLLRHIAKKNKPIIFSSGGSTIKEISEALEIFQEEGNRKIVLMHCLGQYPASESSLNLNVIKMFKLAFPKIIIGYSDHSVDPIKAPKAAVALGAKVIEKHITINKKLPGPDHSFALDATDLKKMVKIIRQTEKDIKSHKKIKLDDKLLGSPERKTYKNEIYVRNFAYRTVFSVENIKKGDRFTKKNIAVLRPGQLKRGLEPKYFEFLIKNKIKAISHISKYKALQWSNILAS